jgi:hypothetical protein
VERLLGRARNLAKEQPAVFFGAAIVSGLLVGRILKSTAEVEFKERGQEQDFDQEETVSGIYLAEERFVPERDVELDLQGLSLDKEKPTH